MSADGCPPCLLRSWQAHQRELYGWLCLRLGSPEQAEDALQEIFLKGLRLGCRFCEVEQPRAWWFEVARHHVVDMWRRPQHTQPLTEEIAVSEPDIDAVDLLSACLPRVLAELSAEDQQILRCCDLEGLSQAAYAAAHGLSLPATKSRLQRARVRLRRQLITSCGVRFDSAGRVCCHTPRTR